MIVVSNGERFECAQAVLRPRPDGKHDVFLYNQDGTCLQEFLCISNLEENYSTEDGDWSEPAPDPLVALAAGNALLKAQVQALTDRGEFMEDCIAEMAMLVYP